MRGFGVPYARTEDGELADPATVERKHQFFCLQCDEPVVLKRGEVRAPHFSHYPNANCSGESVEHLAAKLKLQTYLQSLQGTSTPLQLYTQCDGYFEGHQAFQCRTKELLSVEVSLGGFEDAVLEHPYKEFRLDVATLKESRVIAAFEIFETHRVSREKADAITVELYEIEARSVLYSDQWRLVGEHVVQRCERCQASFLTHQEAYQKHQEQVEKERQRQLENERERQRVYRFVRDYFMKHVGSVDLLRQTAFKFEGMATRCLRCKRAIVTLVIHNRTRFHDAAELLAQTPIIRLWSPEDRPGSYFVNACPYCGRTMPQPSPTASFSDYYWLGHGAIASAFGYHSPYDWRYT